VPPVGQHCTSSDSDSAGATSVYLASRFARREELRQVARELEACGYEVTSRWLDSYDALAPDELDPDGRAAALAAMDLEDVRRASICVAFTEDASQVKPGRGGRHTELGIALALGLRVVLVGPREHVFHCLPDITQFGSWREARQTLFASASENVAVA